MSPDQATDHRRSEERERSSRARTSEERGWEDWRVWIRSRGSETKQLSIPATSLTSNSNSMATNNTVTWRVAKVIGFAESREKDAPLRTWGRMGNGNDVDEDENGTSVPYVYWSDFSSPEADFSLRGSITGLFFLRLRFHLREIKEK